MSEAIYYFSGTNSSYSAALKLAEYLRPAEVVNIFDAPLCIGQDSVGLVFPVHSYDVPKAIKEFIQRSDLSKVNYFYAICTSGGDTGNVFYNLNRQLQKKGQVLNTCAELKLGDNSMVITTDSEVLKNRALAAREIIKEISDEVAGRLAGKKGYKYSPLKALNGFVINLALSHYYKIKHKRVDETRCNKCGKCVNACSSKNIALKNGVITFENKCYDCFGCINLCPRKAITFGKISPDKYRQYVKPEFVFQADI